MNDSAVRSVKVYLRQHLFSPQRNWPKYYFDERSYSQWAAYEIIERLEHSEKDPYKIIQSFISEMDNFSGVKEGIVTQEIFDKVAAIKKIKHRKNMGGIENIFGGLLVCADCRKHLTMQRTSRKNGSGKEIIYFQCDLYRHGTRTGDFRKCKPHSIEWDNLCTFPQACQGVFKEFMYFRRFIQKSPLKTNVYNKNTY